MSPTLVAGGFLSLTVAVIIAHQHPAAAYELSIYASTPIEFWIATGLAFGCALAVSFGSARRVWHRLGLLLGGATSLTVVSLARLRGYFFHGIHDSVTHVGVTREIGQGTLTPFDIAYPALHSIATYIESVWGFSTWEAVHVVPFLLVIVFFVFVPLTVNALFEADIARRVGAFAAFLLVPLHQLASTIHPHPSSEAILFAPLVLYLLVRYLRSTDDSGRARGLSAAGVLLVLATLAAILYHPQQAVNLVLLFGAVSVIQYVARRGTGTLRWARHRPAYRVTIVTTVAFVVWVARSADLRQGIGDALAAGVAVFVGAGGTPGAAIGSQAASVTAIGGSLPVLILKLFFVSMVFVGLSVMLLAFLADGRSRPVAIRSDTPRIVSYLVVGIGVMIPILAVYYLGNVGQYYFRQASFIMVFVTILAAVAIAYVADAVTAIRPARGLAPSLMAGFLVLALLSGLVLFNSPYIHRANQHVTDARVTGYDAAFETTDDDAWFAGIQQQPKRYYGALVSLEDNGRRDGTVNRTEIHRLTDRRPEDWYLVITANTYERELGAYREYRYSRSDLASVSRQPGVNLIRSNGDFSLYVVT